MNQEQRNSLPVHRVSQSEWNEFATIAGLDHAGDGLDRCVHSAYLGLSRTLAEIATFSGAEAWYQSMSASLSGRLEALTRRSRWSRDDFDAWHRATASVDAGCGASGSVGRETWHLVGSPTGTALCLLMVPRSPRSGMGN